MARIDSVETFVARLPVASPLVWGRSGELTAIEHVMVRLATDEGDVGWAEAPPRPSIYGDSVGTLRAAVSELLAPRLVGVDLDGAGAVERALRGVAGNLVAKAALDIAAESARAASAGCHLLDLYPPRRQRLQVSYILGLGDVDDIVSEAHRVWEEGIRVFKLKVGADLERELEIAQRLQAELAGELYLDANETLTMPEAVTWLERFAAAGARWVEEPLPIEQTEARRALRLAGALPVIADDSCFTFRDLQRELAADTFDILNIKPARSGLGVSSRMAEAARRAGKRLMLGSQATAGLGSLHTAICAAHLDAELPCELSFFLRVDGDLLEPGIEIADGFVDVAALRACRLVEALIVS